MFILCRTFDINFMIHACSLSVMCDPQWRQRSMPGIRKVVGSYPGHWSNKQIAALRWAHRYVPSQAEAKPRVRNVVTIATCHVHVMNWAAVADHSSWCVTCYRTAWWGSQGSLGRRSLENRPRARLTPRWGLSITIQKLHLRVGCCCSVQCKIVKQLLSWEVKNIANMRKVMFASNKTINRN